MIDRNFAIFFDESDVKWHFGELSEEFIEKCSNYLRGLNKLGQDLFGEGIATIKLNPESRGGNQPEEIFVVALANQFFFIISDPFTTLRLMEFSHLPKFELEQMRSILAGQASVLFSNLHDRFSGQNIISYFHNALRETGIKEGYSDFVNEKSCSVGKLSLRELSLFHYFLRDEFLNLGKNIDPWAIASGTGGMPIFFSFKSPANKLLISGYLAAIYAFARDLFKSTPLKITFGGDKITSVDIIISDNAILSLVNWQHLLQDLSFIQKWQDVPQNISSELSSNFQTFVAEKLAYKFQHVLNDYSLTDLLYILSNFAKIEQAIPLLLIGKDELRKIFEKEDEFTKKLQQKL